MKFQYMKSQNMPGYQPDILFGRKDPYRNQNTKPKLNKNKYQIPPEQKLMFCDVCIRKCKKKYFVKAFQCQHQICESCFNKYVDSRLDNFQIIICPYQGCYALMKQKIEKNLFGNKDSQLYKKIKRFVYVNRNREYKLCPDTSCEGMIKFKKQFSTCNVCNKKYCFDCLCKSHQGKCEEQLIQYFHNDLELIRCMKCSFFIENTKVCDVIECLCDSTICCKCGDQYGFSKHDCINSKTYQTYLKKRSIEQFIQKKIKPNLSFKTFKNPLARPEFSPVFHILAYIIVLIIFLTLFSTMVVMVQNFFTLMVSIFQFIISYNGDLKNLINQISQIKNFRSDFSGIMLPAIFLHGIYTEWIFETPKGKYKYLFKMLRIMIALSSLPFLLATNYCCYQLFIFIILNPLQVVLCVLGFVAVLFAVRQACRRFANYRFI